MDREYSTAHSVPTSWLVMDGNSGSEYYISFDGKTVKNSVQDIAYSIPYAEVLEGYSVISADGKHVYMCSDTRIIQVDLLTGEIQYGSTKIMSVDDRLLEMDPEAGQYRALVQQEYMKSIQRWDPETGNITFTAYEGLAYQSNSYNPEKGSLE